MNAPRTSRRTLGGLTPLFLTALLASGLLQTASHAAAPITLDRDLTQRVEALLADIERQPTSRDTLVERSRVLWDWANALSLEGVYIPKMLPVVVARAPAPRPGTRAPASYPTDLDNYAHFLAMMQEDRDALGYAELNEHPASPVDSFQTLTVTLTVGTLGIPVGGGILVSQYMGRAMSRLQTTDPAAAGYLTVKASRKATEFEIQEGSVVGPYGGFRAAVTFPKYIVRGEALEPGDTVTIIYGDTSGGGPGVQIGTYTNDGTPLPLFVDPGDGIDYELKAPTFAITGGPVAGVHGFAPSIVGVGETFEVSVRSEDVYYNRAVGDMPAWKVAINGEPWGEIPADGEAIHLIDATFDQPGVYRFQFTSNDGALTGTANPVWVKENPEERLYWGETHGHCGFAEGVGTPEGYYRFAWEDARLDFATLSEHDIWLSDREWQILNEVSADFRRTTGLVTYPGYEWTSDRARGGHHNVLFRQIGMERVPAQSAPDLNQLYSQLDRTHAPEDVLVIPHAHQAGDWRLSDLSFERLIEIMSGHGTFEWFGQRYLENGWRVGFLGASDDHLGHPGYSNGGQARGRRVRSNIFQFGGLAAVYSQERSADAIFAAMRARSTYATSGAQRIIVDASLNGEPMGSEVAEDPGEERLRKLTGRVIGTAPIERIDLIRNGETIDSVAGFEGTNAPGSQSNVRLVVSFFSDSETFFRDNPRGQRPWDGTFTADGATIESLEMLGKVSYLHDQAELRDGVASFSVATRGSARTLLLELTDVSPGAELRFVLDAAREVGRAPTVVRRSARFEPALFSLAVPTDSKAAAHALDAGRWQDVVSIQRADQPRDDISFEFEDTGDPGDWYYLRVVQVDGHRAWGSPWWVGGEPPR